MLILIFRFEDIRIGNNVSPTDYQIFLEKRGVRPFGFYTEWINRNVYIVDVALSPHERTIGKFFRAILRSLENNYGDDLFIDGGSSPLEFGNRCATPDFSFCVHNKFIDDTYVDPDYAEIPTIVGEVAYSQSLDSLLKKSQQYIQDLSADIVIAVKVPKPVIVKEEPVEKLKLAKEELEAEIQKVIRTKRELNVKAKKRAIVKRRLEAKIQKLTIAKGELEAKLEKPTKAKGKLEAPNEVYLYIFYKNVLDPEPITVPFDQEFTFKLKTKPLERKIREELRAEFKHQFDSIDVAILLEKNTIFSPKTLEPKRTKSNPK